MDGCERHLRHTSTTHSTPASQSGDSRNITCRHNESSDWSDGDNAAEWSSPVLAVVLSLMIICTAIGNVLVCLSVSLVRRLRQPPNYLLVSLAVSDLCVAALVMPLALHLELRGVWDLGPTVCDMWVSFDVTSCTASILNLCMISGDRYLAITKPLTYAVRRTSKQMWLCIMGVWVVSCLISIPPLLIMGNEHGTADEPICEVTQNFGYQLYATLGSFYIPLSMMIFMYYKIYAAAKRIVAAEKRSQHPVHVKSRRSSDGQRGCLGVLCYFQDDNKRISLSPSGMARKCIPVCCGQKIQKHSTNLDSVNGSPFIDIAKSEKVMLHRGKNQKSPKHFAGGAGATGGQNTSSNHNSSSVLKERKASITLGVIMTAFTACWLPFFILAILRPFFPEFSAGIPRSLLSFFLWLGYANSMLNPVIYVTFHHDFRIAFKYILLLQCGTLNSAMRQDAYQTQFGASRHHSASVVANTAASVSGVAFETAEKISNSYPNNNPSHCEKPLLVNEPTNEEPNLECVVKVSLDQEDNTTVQLLTREDSEVFL